MGQFDWDYCPSGMDFTGNGGFACMTQMVVLAPRNLIFTQTENILRVITRSNGVKTSWSNYNHDILFRTRNCLHGHKHIHVGLRTAIQMILCLMPMGMVLMGPDCSSWTVVSRGTSWRAPHNFWGNLTLPWIQRANLMISRFLICTDIVTTVT